MAPRKVKVPGPPNGELVEGWDTAVSESTERFSDFVLEDGTVLKGKLVIVSAVRVDGQWDQEGLPIYVVKSSTIVAVAETPEALRKKVH